ncbi:hypothetical protein JTB14_018724 [Gonioctena quinquepunctata]|nr:hypothetical protein JTB14_018724 [Gonioctena quinquepunctata]
MYVHLPDYDVSSYSPSIIYKKGKDILIADLLSRDIISSDNPKDSDEELIIQIVLPISADARTNLVEATGADIELQSLVKYMNQGFSDEKSNLPEIVKNCP